MTSTGGFLIWVRGDRGPVPQKWAEPPPAITNYWKNNVLSTIALTPEDFAQPLDYLVMKYPAPVSTPEARFTIDHTKAIG